MINKNPPDVQRSKMLEELRQKAFDDFKKQGPFSPRKAVYNLLPSAHRNHGRSNTINQGSGRLLNRNRVATNSNSIATEDRDRSSLWGSKESLLSKKQRE